MSWNTFSSWLLGKGEAQTMEDALRPAAVPPKPTNVLPPSELKIPMPPVKPPREEKTETAKPWHDRTYTYEPLTELDLALIESFKTEPESWDIVPKEGRGRMDINGDAYNKLRDIKLQFQLIYYKRTRDGKCDNTYDYGLTYGHINCHRDVFHSWLELRDRMLQKDRDAARVLALAILEADRQALTDKLKLPPPLIK